MSTRLRGATSTRRRGIGPLLCGAADYETTLN